MCKLIILLRCFTYSIKITSVVYDLLFFKDAFYILVKELIMYNLLFWEHLPHPPPRNIPHVRSLWNGPGKYKVMVNFG